MTTNDFQNKISERKFSKACDAYIECNDDSIRTNIYLYYYNRIDFIISSIQLPKEDKEDLSQDLKEYATILINRVLEREICHNFTSDYKYSTYIANNINRELKNKLAKLKKSQVCESLNTFDVISNASVEGEIISRLTSNEMIKYFDEVSKEYKDKRSFDRLTKYYGIGCTQKNTCDMAKEENVTAEAIRQNINKALTTIKKEYFHYRKQYIDGYPFYEECDSLSDSHTSRKL